MFAATPAGRWKKLKLATTFVLGLSFKYSDSYKQEGDETFNTAENRRKRAALKHDTKIQAFVSELWDCTDIHKDEDGFTDYGSYRHLMSLVHRCLVEVEPGTAPDTDKEEWQTRSDWEKDSKRPDPSHPTLTADKLTRWQFYESVFELADTWSFDIDADEYAGFAHHLLERVTVKRQDGTRYFQDVDKITMIPMGRKQSFISPGYQKQVRGADSSRCHPTPTPH